ncbi:hypothetical protein NMG60_11000140 [Bertholletia excelsa]
MMQPELAQEALWPFYSVLNSPRDDVGACGGEFSFPFTNSGNSSGISSEPFFSNEFLDYSLLANELQVTSPMERNADEMGGIEPTPDFQFEDICRWLSEGEVEGSFLPQLSPGSEEVFTPCQSSEASTVFSPHACLILPVEGMEIDSNLSIQYLLKAYGEAMEMGQRELADVIAQRITEKVNPVGEPLERLAFNLFQSTGKQADYLKQESGKNFEAAFKAFYKIFPYGKFAHFSANSAIFEAMPETAETIHIVDFDMREGVQWAPLIEAIASRHKELRLTSIKSGEDCSGDSLYWSFEETKSRLCNHARSFGLNLRVEEMGIEDLATEIMKMRRRDGGKEFWAFNCMVELPHMGLGRSRGQLMEFLRVAKEFSGNTATNTGGIITIGDGDASKTMRGCYEYGLFFDDHLNRYQALYESMEWNFPGCFAEGRIAMESLFVAPSVSSISWLQKWEELREGYDHYVGIGLKGVRISGENLMEAKEMVKEEESQYVVRVEGKYLNEMILEWRGTPLVRVSTWR